MRIMQIRRAKTDADFEAIVKIQCRCFEGGALEVPDFSGAWWVAESESGIVGFAGIHASRNWEKTGYLCRAAVLRRYRGQGIQKRFIHYREKWARAQKWQWIVTDTRAWNSASSNSLISCGYKLWQPPDWAAWVEDADVLYWRKRL